jgi:thioredoxin 1
MSNAIALNASEFKEKVLEGEGLSVVDFWATWCGPCQMLHPILDQLAEEEKDRITIYSVNVDENQNLATEYGVMSIPTLLFFKDGEAVDRTVGLMQLPALKKKVEELS